METDITSVKKLKQSSKYFNNEALPLFLLCYFGKQIHNYNKFPLFLAVFKCTSF